MPECYSTNSSLPEAFDSIHVSRFTLVRVWLVKLLGMICCIFFFVCSTAETGAWFTFCFMQLKFSALFFSKNRPHTVQSPAPHLSTMLFMPVINFSLIDIEDILGYGPLFLGQQQPFHFL